MRRWTIVIVMGLVGCVGGPGDGFGGDAGVVGSSGGSSGASSTSSSGGSSGSSNQIRTSDFSQTCQAAADCVPIYQGEACNSCLCPNAAIASSDLQNYQSKLSTARRSCPPSTADCVPCPTPATLCAGNKCNVASGIPRDAGGDG